MKKYRLEIILFIINAVYMILELAASRILSPYFGNTNLVWTTIIGIILLSSSVGNFVGGKLADKKISPNTLKTLLKIAGTFILIIPLIQTPILDLIATKISSIELGAIVASIILFFLPTMIFGLFSPIIMTIKSQKEKKIGSTSGRIYAVGTIGSLLGTFIGGFILLPNIGSNQLLVILAMIILLLVFLVENLDIKWDIILVSLLIVAASFLCVHYRSIRGEQRNDVLNGIIGASIDYDTQYSRVTIVNESQALRSMLVGKTTETKTLIDPSKSSEIVSPYISFYDLMFETSNEIDEVLMIGGGGYAYPKHYLSSYPNKTIDVVEIDGDITALAKEYFHLDTIINKYDPKEERLNIIKTDGRVYLNRCNKKYDAILNDAFNGIEPPATLTTVEAAEKIHNSLNEDGLYLTNVIGSINGSNSLFLKTEVNTLKQVFKYVYIRPVFSSKVTDIVQNFMVIASDKELQIDNTIELEIEDNTLILTDDYAPIGKLIKYQ